MVRKDNYFKTLVMLIILQLLMLGGKAQNDHQHIDSSGYQLPNGQYGNVPHPNHPEPSGDFTLPPEAYMNVDYDSEHDTKIYGKVKRTDGVDSTVFYLKKEPLPDKERILREGSEFLLLNVLLSPKRIWNKILIRVLSNPPTNMFVGDTGWVELSHTTLYPYYDNDKNCIDSNYVYKKYAKAAAKFRQQSETTSCRGNKKCYLNYATYYECMAESERTHTEPKCSRKDCTIEDCPEDEKK